ncbi:family 43 glycosylhydrolase [Sphingobium sp. ZW T5_29]|uniref:family 43 glycosylhydrolase n=1 Tax=Sphingobium sp. ZW T5_29 TaxID=3378077 RepID=UPI003851FEE6
MSFGFLIAASLMSIAADARATGFQGADPHAVFIGDELWVFPTGGPGKQWGGNRLGAWSSSDLQNWKSRGEVINRSQVKWFEADGSKRHFLWAPSVVQSRARWYLYYSVGPQNPTPSRIGVAIARAPGGPYVDTGKPLLTGGKGFEAIDPMVFKDPRSKRTYLYAGGSAGARLRIFEMNPDMVSIKREVPVKQLPAFTEAPFMHERNGTYYLSYSHGRWKSSSYSVHYATSQSPTGPWRYRGAVLVSDGTRQGPGHHSFVRDPRSGEWLIVYHRWEGPNDKSTFAGRRNIAIERVTYGSDGRINSIRMTDGDSDSAPVVQQKEKREKPSSSDFFQRMFGQ